jgi:hypothetical protein
MAKSKLQVASRKRRSSASQAEKRLAAAEKLARQIARWHKHLAPQFPDIDPHDLDLMIASLLRTPKKRTEIMFLKRREDGFYVF